MMGVQMADKQMEFHNPLVLIVHERYAALPVTFPAPCHNTYYSGNTLHMHAHMHLVLGLYMG